MDWFFQGYVANGRRLVRGSFSLSTPLANRTSLVKSWRCIGQLPKTELRSHRHWISHGGSHRRPKDWYTMPGVVAMSSQPSRAGCPCRGCVQHGSLEHCSRCGGCECVKEAWNFVGRLKLWSKSVQHRVGLGWLVRKGLSHSLSQWSTRIYEFVILREFTVPVPAKCSKWSVESWLSGFFNSKIHRLSLCGLVFSGICRQGASFS